MSDLPTTNLLESTHKFPGPYMFKVIGRMQGGFAARVVAAVREELRFETDPPFSTHETPSGRHVSVTLEPELASGEQVLAVYARLRRVEGVVVLW